MTGELNPGTVGLTTQSVNHSRNAVQTVSQFAQASITLVPQLNGMPSWFAPIQNVIDTAQGHSQNWLQSICPAVSLGLPQAIVDYNQEFQTGSQKILDTLDEIGSSQPTGDQKSAISTALNSLLDAAQKQATAAATTKTDLSQYMTGLVQDVNALGDAIGTLEASLANGSQYVQTLKNTIGENFVDVESKLSPCNVIVMMNMNIEVSVSMTGAPQPAIAAVLAQSLIGMLDSNVKNTMDSLQVVLDSWGTLQAKINAVISDLQSVGNDYASFLQQFDLATAQTQWDQLSSYAESLLPDEEQ